MRNSPHWERGTKTSNSRRAARTNAAVSAILSANGCPAGATRESAPTMREALKRWARPPARPSGPAKHSVPRPGPPGAPSGGQRPPYDTQKKSEERA